MAVLRSMPLHVLTPEVVDALAAAEGHASDYAICMFVALHLSFDQVDEDEPDPLGLTTWRADWCGVA